MDRLTRWNDETESAELKGWGQDYWKEFKDSLDLVDSMELSNAINKLAEYEDAEEQGWLIRLPCKIGDTVWGIRAYKGTKHPQQGVVSEMYFLPDMSLQIVIKHVCRGRFGETIFLTREEAEQALRKRENE